MEGIGGRVGGKKEKSEERGGREREEEKEGGEMSHKSEKIATITINVEALCNPCQGIE